MKMNSLPAQESHGCRVMAYCHDSVGVGHLRRTLAICEHLGRRREDVSFLLLTGTPYVPLFRQLPRVDYVKLPALAKERNGIYASKYLGLSLQEMMSCRESMLLSLAQSYEPDLVLVDKAPVGVCRELLPTLNWLRQHRPQTRLIFGMRDIEDEAESTIAQWTRDGVFDVLENCYDEIWVYGMAELFDPVPEYRLSDRIRNKMRFMGYVARQEHTRAAPGDRQRVLVTVGGGTDGESVLRTYLDGAAQAVGALGAQSVVVAGPDLPRAASQRLRESASRFSSVQWVDFEGQMERRIASANLVVSMGGYNTLCEIAMHRKPALIIPRVRPRCEQAIRAEVWSRLCGVSVLDPDQLTSNALAARVTSLLANAPATHYERLDMRGLDRVAERFETIWNAPSAASGVRSGAG